MSLDAQCLLIQLTEGELRPPDIWRHDRSGALSCAYEGGEHVFTWPADDVAEMARRWRDSHTRGVPQQARPFLDAHKRLEALADEAGLPRPSAMVHDLGRMEVRGVWEDEELVVVIDEIGDDCGAERCVATTGDGSAGRSLRG
jgi:hypothetical protein